MNAPIKLSDVPRRFLDPTAWAELRAFAPNDLFALIYINAPCPDEANPNDFFWDRPRSAADAMRCYETGRSLLRQSRSLLSSGKLVATGRDSGGKRTTIPASEWPNLWPMFATDGATGPDRVFTDVQVFEATSSETPQAQLSSDCIAWLKERNIVRLTGKKSLYWEARQKFGSGLTHAIFNAAYLAVFGRGRGRPKSSVKSTK